MSLQPIAVRLGLPPATRCISLIKSMAAASQPNDEQTWLQRWDRASKKLRQQINEPAPAICLARLPQEIEGQAQDLLRAPYIERSFALLPYHWVWVKLDQLITWQSYVNLSHVSRLRRTLKKDPSPTELLRFIANDGEPLPPHQTSTRDGNHFRCTSVSNDLRVLDTVHLEPEHINGYIPYGRPCVAIVSFIGYSVNIMSATYFRNRLVLTNGTHHAAALAAAGVTEAPCLVRDVSNDSELELLGIPEGDRPIEWYFSTPRPPRLGDFFDQDLTINIQAPQAYSLVDVDLRFTLSGARIPALPEHTISSTTDTDSN